MHILLFFLIYTKPIHCAPQINITYISKNTCTEIIPFIKNSMNRKEYINSYRCFFIHWFTPTFKCKFITYAVHTVMYLIMFMNLRSCLPV